MEKEMNRTSGNAGHTFRQEYENRLMTAAEAAALIENGASIYVDDPLSQPYGLVRAVEERARQGFLHDVTFNILLDAHPYACYSEELADRIHGVSWFSGQTGRRAIAKGLGDIMPCIYHSAHTVAEHRPMDLWLLQTSGMDENGYFTTPDGSLGETMKKTSSRIMIQVNRNLPVTKGATKIHISEVAAVCELDEPLPIVPRVEIDEISETIGGLIAEEIPDGATIQLGIGSIPDAVGKALLGKHHLGIHSELLTNSLVDLIRAGAADNSRKPLHTGKTIATFAMGDEEMYKFLDHDPDIEFLSAYYVNDPGVIAQHPDMISVNAALEVDFFGQVCAESVGTVHISGSGGQIDFVQGAVRSPGGKSFIAFPSTAAGGTISRIRPILTPGSIVTTSKNDVDYIVTEYGIAPMRARTVRERTRALISIAHPKFREELEFAARERHFL